MAWEETAGRRPEVWVFSRASDSPSSSSSSSSSEVSVLPPSLSLSLVVSVSDSDFVSLSDTSQCSSGWSSDAGVYYKTREMKAIFSSLFLVSCVCSIFNVTQVESTQSGRIIRIHIKRSEIDKEAE